MTPVPPSVRPPADAALRRILRAGARVCVPGILGAAFSFAPAPVAGAGVDRLRAVAISAAMPRLGDHTLLSWRDGAPYFTGARYSSERRTLRLETGYYSAEFDTERIAMTGFARAGAPRDEAAAARSALAAEPLPAAQLHLRIGTNGTEYACIGRRTIALDNHGMPANPLEFPVQVIESGRFFQKFALHDLEFHDAAGRRLAAAVRLEVSAWADRIALTLVIRPERSMGSAHAFLRLQSAGGIDASLAEAPASWEAEAERRATLTLEANGSARAPTAPAGVEVRVTPADVRGRATVRWNPEELCHTVRLEAPPWPEPREGIFAEAMLDAWEAYAVTIENLSAVTQHIPLNFEHTPIKAITGFVPMLVGAKDRPTGIPVQTSKNWHQPRAGETLPYAGPWIHGRTWLNLAPGSKVALGYGTTFARWGGIPSASLAQLSLVGWGHNGFWDQFALGSFGETFCFQAGRVMRRALFTDFRPLFQRGFVRDERWAWTGNVGGADTMVRLDAQGRYVPFQRNVTRYVSHGPNLAHLAYEELSADGAVRSRVEVMLPRTDDCARVYLRIHYSVTRPVKFSRLALFQLGADYYNDADSPQIAWGNAGAFVAERSPTPVAGVRALPAWKASGDDPWISLHGDVRADTERTGQATRGLILREWRAVLGGRPAPVPYFAAMGSRGSKSRLAAEIVPPPDVDTLVPGDSVDMLVELLALPLTAERYYGSDPAFATALAAGANTWRMVHREAAANRPTLQLPDGSEVTGWPLTISAAPEGGTAFTLSGGLGWIPVRLTGLRSADAVELWHETAGGLERVVQGDPARAYWQSDYNAGAGRWSITYNLPASGAAVAYMARSRFAVPSTSDHEPEPALIQAP